MLTWFQWVSLLGILGVTLAGGALPLLRPEQARQDCGFPMGKAFASGVFLALSLLMMLPAGLNILRKSAPQVDFPIAACLAALSFFFLLSLEHATHKLHNKAENPSGRIPALVPVVMTVMITIPSFFLGAALGVSSTHAAVVIFFAIVIHKGSAAFALALNMVRSTLSSRQVLAVFFMFVLATPLGIIVGAEVHAFLGMKLVTAIKGGVLSMAAGVFLFMATMHELEYTPLINECRTFRGVLFALSGFLLTALARFMMGEAHHL